MSDLINRVEVREFIKSYSHSTDVVYHMVKHLYEVPTIDAVPVRHGEWKPFDLTYGRSIYSCSVCEQATEVPMCMEKPMYAYCPNCGAKMNIRRMTTDETSLETS